MKTIKKTVWTLNIDNYAPEICQLTYPLLLAYARKIGADFRIIDMRQFPGMPAVYEKLQIFTLGQDSDWNIYIDSDAVIFPDMIDVTERVPKDTVVHYGRDHASNRWRYDDYFRRDGRDIGSCNWFAAASNWCLDLWHPLDDISLSQALENIRPIVTERMAGITPAHLIDDYTLSRNIARFGLKLKTVHEILKADNDPGVYVWHVHRKPIAAKLAEIRVGLNGLDVHVEEMREMRSWTLDRWVQAFGVYDPIKADLTDGLSTTRR